MSADQRHITDRSVEVLEPVKVPTPFPAQHMPGTYKQNVSESGMSFQQKMILGSALGLTGLALIYFVHNKYWAIRENKTRDDSLEEGTSEDYANRIKMAFDNDGWWGTDVPALRVVMLDIPNIRVWENIKKDFRKLSAGAHLLTEMEKELTKTEWLEMQAIFSTLPSGSSGESGRTFDAGSIAKRINAAVNNVWFGFWTDVDNDAIDKALVEVPTKRDWEDVKDAYQRKYTADLEDVLDDALWEWYGEDWEAVIESKPA